jgi:hypothetical protein
MEFCVRYGLIWGASMQGVFWTTDWVKITTIASSLVFPALLLWVFSMPVVRTLWSGTRAPARWAVVFLFLLMLNGQLLRKNELTYPVVSWTMYASRRPEPLQFTELTGVRADGSSFQLDIDRLVLSTGLYTQILADYHKQTELLRPSDPVEATRRQALLAGVIRTLAKHQGTPPGASELTRVEMALRTIGRDGTLTGKDTFLVVDLSSNGGTGE